MFLKEMVSDSNNIVYEMNQKVQKMLFPKFHLIPTLTFRRLQVMHDYIGALALLYLDQPLL